MTNDAGFALAYAIIMLNTDQHNHNVRKQNIPMTVEVSPLPHIKSSLTRRPLKPFLKLSPRTFWWRLFGAHVLHLWGRKAPEEVAN